MNPFDFVRAIGQTKKDVIREADDPQSAEKGYNPFIVNRAFSYHRDTIMLANQVNSMPAASNLMQFDFLINMVRPSKRYAKWHKPEVDERAELVSEYFGCGPKRAREYLTLLGDKDVDQIKESLRRGGKTS